MLCMIIIIRLYEVSFVGFETSMGNYHPNQNGRTKGSQSGHARLGRAGLNSYSSVQCDNLHNAWAFITSSDRVCWGSRKGAENVYTGD